MRRPGEDLHIVLDQVAHQAGIAGAVGHEALAAVGFTVDRAILDIHAAHLAPIHLIDELRIRFGVRGTLRGTEVAEHRHQHHGDHDP